MSSILTLPNEILIQIVSLLFSESDLNSIVCTNRHFYALFNDTIYHLNISQHSSSALLWASEHNRPSTLRRLLSFGADISVKRPPSYVFRLQDGTTYRNHTLNGLYLASINGGPEIARILLEAGINDSEYARGTESIPLYYALQTGHDDVALVLLEHFSDVNGPIMWTEYGSSLFYLAAYFRLPEMVRFLLGKGADVHAEDKNGMTALQYALLSGPDVCKACFEGSFFGIRKKVTFESRGKGYAADVETVRLLLDAGAYLEKKRELGSWGHRHSATQLAKSHPSAEMRRLCGIERNWLEKVMGWA